jgi:hypothetical protein
MMAAIGAAITGLIWCSSSHPGCQTGGHEAAAKGEKLAKLLHISINFLKKLEGKRFLW